MKDYSFMIDYPVIFLTILMPVPNKTKNVYNRIHLGCGILTDILYDRNGKCLNDFNFV